MGAVKPQMKQWEHSDLSCYLAEFIGTFFLVLTVGCNVLTGSVGSAISIGGMLMVMVFALGSVSGAHFNPAVTVAVLLSGRGVIGLSKSLLYIIFQLLGGIAAGGVYTVVCGGTTFVLEPVGKYNSLTAGVVEALYTMLLCYVVLNTATTQKQDGNHYFGLAIGFVVVSAALAIGGISGCSLNPAVSFGTMMVAAFSRGTSALAYFPLYFFVPFLGSFMGWIAFYLVRKADEYNDVQHHQN